MKEVRPPLHQQNVPSTEAQAGKQVMQDPLVSVKPVSKRYTLITFFLLILLVAVIIFISDYVREVRLSYIDSVKLANFFPWENLVAVVLFLMATPFIKLKGERKQEILTGFRWFKNFSIAVVLIVIGICSLLFASLISPWFMQMPL
jgi:hypothetical protein